jgi:uncharacterized membrane protein
MLVVPAWLQVFGRMHPLLLHFPIVLTLIFVALLFLAPKKLLAEHKLKEFTEWFLLLSAFTCSLTALMGFFLSRDGGYDQEAIAWHKWTGIALPFVLFIVYSFRNYVFNKTLIARFISICVAVIITAAAHYGGVITHGENFVLQPVTPEKIKMVPTLEEAVVFADLVQPILDKKCLSCHNNKKAKGELIMETRELLLKGGENGKLWDTTKPDLGLMMKRIHLPLEDKKHMPPSGKPQLTDEEVVILQSWIKGGANFDKRVIELEPTDTLFLLAKKTLKPSSEAQYDFAAADDNDIIRLSNNNRVVAPIATGSPALKVNFYNRGQFTSASLKELNKLAPQIVEMSLINMPVKDEDLLALKPFTNLRKLYLNFTTITGKTLGELQTLPNLQVLSLTGTKIEYNHLRVLAQFPKLHTVYLWSTSVTNDQIAELKKQDKRIAYQTGFSGDTLVMQLTPPIIENEQEIIYTSLGLRLKHNIGGTEVRYSLDGEDPDSIKSAVYKDSVMLTSAVKVKTKAFKPGWISSEINEKYFFKSTYVPDTIILQTKPDDRFKSTGSKTLYDNEKSDLNVFSEKWLGYKDNPFTALLVLDSQTTVKNVTLSTLRDLGGYIFPPTRVEVWGGNDQKNLKLLKTVIPEPAIEKQKNANLPIECDFEPISLKYIKVIARPVARIPSWHGGKGEKAYVFVDEIFVN